MNVAYNRRCVMNVDYYRRCVMNEEYYCRWKEAEISIL